MNETESGNEMNKNTKIGIGVLGLAVIALLAFGVFGIQTAFYDNEVAEAGPIFQTSQMRWLRVRTRNEAR